MNIGFDIDGTLSKQNTAVICLMKDKPEIERIYYSTVEPIFHPEYLAGKNDNIVLITGRKEELRDITEAWCKKWFPKYKLYITPTVTWTSPADWSSWFKEIALNKSKIINELNLDVYFEDMPQTVEELRKLCPNCKIIQFGGRLE